jgi:hypothetical protein
MVSSPKNPGFSIDVGHASPQSAVRGCATAAAMALGRIGRKTL